MKRFWLLGLFLAGALVALNAPAFAKDMMDSQSSDDMSDQLDDINSALGSMAVKMNDMDSKLALKISGDMRLRYAFTAQSRSLSAGPTIADQSLGRYRARVGAEISRGDFTAKVRFATGATNSPWSQNNTFDTAMVDPTINIDTAQISWKPGFASNMLTVTAGKMGNPLTKTPITWDPDIQPEGALIEIKKDSFTLRATYFELQNQFASGTTFGNIDLFMDNIQAEYEAKMDDSTSVGLMAGYEYIPNATALATAGPVTTGVQTTLGKNPITGFTGVTYAGSFVPVWNNVEGMLYFKHKIGDVPLKWYVHATDNLNGKNLPVASGSDTLTKFSNQYAFLFGVDIGSAKELGQFAGTLFVAQTDPNCQLPYLVDDDSGRTNTQYIFGSLSTLLADHVTLKLSDWLTAPEYGNLVGTNSRNPKSITYLDCIVDL